MPQLKKVKIFGERNTSTNALKALIEMNSDARVQPSVVNELRPDFNSLPRKIGTKLLGIAWRERAIDRVFAEAPPEHAWKHCAPTFTDVSGFAQTLVVMNVRNPFSWLRALHKRPYHAHGAVSQTLEEFVTTPWQPAQRDRIGDKPLSPIALYNTKLSAYLTFRDRLIADGCAVAIVKFEDFAIDQLSVLGQLEPNLSGFSSAPEALEKAAKTKDQGRRDAAYYRDYYGNERWKSEIGTQAQALISDGIDWSVAEQIGYQDWPV